MRLGIVFGWFQTKPRGKAAIKWVWLKIEEPGLRRFWSVFYPSGQRMGPTCLSHSQDELLQRLSDSPGVRPERPPASRSLQRIGAREQHRIQLCPALDPVVNPHPIPLFFSESWQQNGFGSRLKPTNKTCWCSRECGNEPGVSSKGKKRLG